MTLTAYTAMVTNLVALCRSPRRCVVCCDVVTLALISGYLNNEERALVEASPFIRAIFFSRETSLREHTSLRSLLEELGRILFPTITLL